MTTQEEQSDVERWADMRARYRERNIKGLLWSAALLAVTSSAIYLDMWSVRARGNQSVFEFPAEVGVELSRLSGVLALTSAIVLIVVLVLSKRSRSS